MHVTTSAAAGCTIMINMCINLSTTVLNSECCYFSMMLLFASIWILSQHSNLSKYIYGYSLHHYRQTIELQYTQRIAELYV